MNAPNPIEYYTDCEELEPEPSWEINPELYNTVYDGMPDDLSLEEKIIYIYMKLCKILKYDSGFLFYERINDERYEYYFSKDRLENIVPGSKIICFDFTRIFHKFVSEMRKNGEPVKSTILNRYYSHFENRINLTDKKIIIVFDSTDRIQDGNDIMRMQAGMQLLSIYTIYDDERNN